MAHGSGSPLRLPSPKRQARLERRRQGQDWRDQNTWAREEAERHQTSRGYGARDNAENDYSGRDPESY